MKTRGDIDYEVNMYNTVVHLIYMYYISPMISFRTHCYNVAAMKYTFNMRRKMNMKKKNLSGFIYHKIRNAKMNTNQ